LVSAEARRWPEAADHAGYAHHTDDTHHADPDHQLAEAVPAQHSIAALFGDARAHVHGGRIDRDTTILVQSTLGIDARGVEIHEGHEPEQAGAEAIASGDHVWMKPGGYDPGSPAGLQLLGHELAHVQQQRDGRVAIPQHKDGNINADPALEAEADAASSGPPGARVGL
jgi:hypothetical protein